MKKFVRNLSIIIILAVGFLFTRQSIAQTQIAFNADVQAEARRGGYQLIDMDELWQFYQQADNNLLLVDTAAICKHPELPKPEPEKKCVMGRLFGK